MHEPTPHLCWPLLLVVGALLLPAWPASADRASLAIEQSVTGQTNLFRTEDDEEADASYEIRPRLTLRRPAGDFQYRLEYSPTYDLYFETDGIDGFDQYGRAEASYSPLPTSTASIRADLAYYRSIRSDEVDGPEGIPEIVPDVSGRVFRALGSAGYEQLLTPTTTAAANLGLQSYDYTTPNNADSLGFGGELSLRHELRSTLELGGMLFASHRRFDDLALLPESQNVVLHLGPTIRYLPTPTLSFEAQAGPAWLFIDRDGSKELNVSRFRTTGSGGSIDAAVFDDCGQGGGQPLLSQCPLAPAGLLGPLIQDQRVDVAFPGGSRSSDDDEITAFARALLRKDEPWGYGSIEYFREENASSGSGATSIRDSVTATVELDAGDLWSFRLRGNWNQRETVERIDQVDVIAGPSPLFAGGGLFFAEAEGLVVVDDPRRKTTQYWVDARLRRRLTHALYAELDLRYLYQDRDGSQGATDTFDNWRGVFMLRYELTPLDY